MQYILQTKEKGYCCCILISFLNARIYYGKPIIKSLSDPYWEVLANKYCCISGAVIGSDNAEVELGVKRIPIDKDNIPLNLPAEILVYTKVGFHSCLVVNAKSDIWEIVNFNGHRGSVVEKVNKQSIKFPDRGIPVDKCFKLELRS